MTAPQSQVIVLCLKESGVHIRLPLGEGRPSSQLGQVINQAAGVIAALGRGAFLWLWGIIFISVFAQSGSAWEPSTHGAGIQRAQRMRLRCRQTAPPRGLSRLDLHPDSAEQTTLGEAATDRKKPRADGFLPGVFVLY